MHLASAAEPLTGPTTFAENDRKECIRFLTQSSLVPLLSFEPDWFDPPPVLSQFIHKTTESKKRCCRVSMMWYFWNRDNIYRNPVSMTNVKCKDKIVLVLSHDDVWGSGAIAPRILNFAIKRRWVLRLVLLLKQNRPQEQIYTMRCPYAYGLTDRHGSCWRKNEY